MLDMNEIVLLGVTCFDMFYEIIIAFIGKREASAFHFIMYTLLFLLNLPIKILAKLM